MRCCGVSSAPSGTRWQASAPTTSQDVTRENRTRGPLVRDLSAWRKAGDVLRWLQEHDPG